MKKKYKIEDSLVVHCPTMELANQVLRIAHNLGYKWFFGSPYTSDNNWRMYGEESCYRIVQGTVGKYSQCVNNTQYCIISAQEFICRYSEKCTDEIGRLEKEIENLKTKVSNLEKKFIKISEKRVMYEGDPERGSEIIQILQNLGGCNTYNYSGKYKDVYYYIDDRNIINGVVTEENRKNLKDYYVAALPPKIEIEKVTFKKYQSVLVRYNHSSYWSLEVFDCITSEGNIKVLNNFHIPKECIPVNDETIKLWNTKDNPDKKYIIIK